MVFSNLGHTDLQGALSVFQDSAASAGLTWQKVANKGKLVVGVKRGHRDQKAKLSVLEKETEGGLQYQTTRGSGGQMEAKRKLCPVLLLHGFFLTKDA